MHLKTLRHRGNTINKLLLYMIQGMNDQKIDLAIAHNLPSFDHKKMVKAFLENDNYRKSPAKVKWYHEILSFSPMDKEHITNQVLEDIARKYIEMRNPLALCFAVAHLDSTHPHLHFCLSGTEYRSKKTLRMDDETFKNLREGMEKYQLKHFPELKNSIVYLGKEGTKKRAIKRDQNVRKEKEFQMRIKEGAKQSEKERLSKALLEIFNQSQSPSSFYGGIERVGVELNYRNGKVNGVKSKRTYRFSTLGITSEMIQSLDRLSKRYKEMENLRSSDNKELDNLGR